MRRLLGLLLGWQVFSHRIPCASRRSGTGQGRRGGVGGPQAGHAFTLACFVSWISWGSPNEAHRHANEMLTLAEEHNFPFYVAWGMMRLVIGSGSGHDCDCLPNRKQPVPEGHAGARHDLTAAEMQGYQRCQYQASGPVAIFDERSSSDCRQR